LLFSLPAGKTGLKAEQPEFEKIKVIPENNQEKPQLAAGGIYLVTGGIWRVVGEVQI